MSVPRECRVAFLVAGAMLAASCIHPAATSPTAVPAVTVVPTAAGTATAPTWVPAPRTKTSGCSIQNGLPDPACTPGAVDPRVNQEDVGTTICTRGYTTKVRPPESVTEKIKRDQMAAYGLQGIRLADEELDHLIPLELGGAPSDVANLWPEPWNGDNNARQKDAVENFLHDQVCRGAMQLADAQRTVATDWLSVYAQRALRPAQ